VVVRVAVMVKIVRDPLSTRRFVARGYVCLVPGGICLLIRGAALVRLVMGGTLLLCGGRSRSAIDAQFGSWKCACFSARIRSRDLFVTASLTDCRESTKIDEALWLGTFSGASSLRHAPLASLLGSFCPAWLMHTSQVNDIRRSVEVELLNLER
jgi:hypothetical protein